MSQLCTMMSLAVLVTACGDPAAGGAGRRPWTRHRARSLRPGSYAPVLRRASFITCAARGEVWGLSSVIPTELVSVPRLPYRQQRPRAEGELVFPNRNGAPMESSSVTDALEVALRRAGLPRIRVHDLRHTTATVLLEAGVHPKLVQYLLGHSTVALTLQTDKAGSDVVS